ncbi:MAG: hypothetical protein NZ898_14830 [Myxococcota bacterium]|nr:hypothetical protein [Myxococcota bacterium]
MKKCIRAVSACFVLAGCGGALPGSGAAGIGAECRGDFGESPSAKILETFLGASADFVDTAASLEGELVQACRDMARELGLPEAGGTEGARAACEPVSVKIREEMQALRAEANLAVRVASTPPVCEVSVDAYARCAGECDVNVDPGQVDVQCEGGELRGGCSGECTGRCAVQASGSCSGSCEGTCSGGCTGTCQGRCEGTCRARAADGSCNGACEGTCHGTCSAGCRGSCQGQCVVEARASCSGECRGSCSVAFTEPRCTGTVRPPSMSAECQAACDAKLEAQAQCRPGEVTVVVDGNATGNAAERLARLRQVLEVGLPVVGRVGAKLQRLARTGETIVRVSRDLPNAVGDLGANAVACASAAVGALPRATVQVSVSIEVSASVSASAGAG